MLRISSFALELVSLLLKMCRSAGRYFTFLPSAFGVLDGLTIVIMAFPEEHFYRISFRSYILYSVQHLMPLYLCRLVGWLGFNGSLKQYFRLYRTVSKSGRKKKEMTDERKKCPNNPIRTHCKHSRPSPSL